MNSFELNKILGALLGTCLVLLSLNIAVGALFTPTKPEKPGYEIAVPEEAAGSAGQQAGAATIEPIGPLLASADIQKGINSAKKCLSCHTFQKGEANKVGPNLYGVFNRAKAAVPNFAYSAALKAKGGEWPADELNQFIANPKAHTPGTLMNFAGIPRANERADLIAYMNSLSDTPAPLAKSQ